MRLNSKGKLAKFYMWLPPDDKQLPQDFCTYFWGLVGRAFFVFGMGGMVLVTLVSGAIWLVLTMWAHKFLTLFILLILLFTVLSIWISERKKKIKIEIWEEAKTIIGGKVDAVKRRYCPRIEWK